MQQRHAARAKATCRKYRHVSIAQTLFAISLLNFMEVQFEGHITNISDGRTLL